MRLKEIYDKHLALFEAGIGLVVATSLLISLAVYNVNKNVNKIYENIKPLITDDSVNINIDLNNFLFSNFNSEYEVFRYYFDRENEVFIKDDNFKLNSFTYHEKEKYLECELKNNGYDENENFFINNALNNFAYISCLKEDEPYLFSSLDTLKESFKSDYLLNYEVGFEEAFDKINKKIVFYYEESELFKEYELLNYLSLYIKRGNNLVLLNISELENKLKENFPSLNLEYLRNEKVTLANYEGGKIITTSSAEVGSLTLKNEILEV